MKAPLEHGDVSSWEVLRNGGMRRLQRFDCTRGGLSADDGAGDGAGLLAVRRLAGEEERRLQRPGQRLVRVDAAHSGIRIRAAAEGIALPVVRPRRDEG